MITSFVTDSLCIIFVRFFINSSHKKCKKTSYTILLWYRPAHQNNPVRDFLNLLIPLHRHSVHNAVSPPQQSRPSNIQSPQFNSSSHMLLFRKAFIIWPEFTPMHSHTEQYLKLTQVPQQSPPSKVQTSTLVSSLQKPFPTLAFVILSVCPVLHLHSEHCSLLTQGPQQSPPSKEQWRLLL